MNHSFIYESGQYLEKFEIETLIPISESIPLLDKLVDQYRTEHEVLNYFGESTLEVPIPVMEDGKNIFQSIGEKIEQLFKAFAQAFSSIVDKIKGMFPSAKKDESLKRAWEAHPELAESFIKGINDGSIKYSDYENIDKMVDDAMKIIKDLETGRVEAKTGVEKINEVITKFNDNLTPTAELLNTVGGMTRGITNILGFKNNIQETIFKAQKNQKRIDAIKATAREDVYKANPDAVMTARTWRLKIAEKYTGEYSKTTSKLVGVLSKLSGYADKYGDQTTYGVKGMKAIDSADGLPSRKRALMLLQDVNALDSSKPSRPSKKGGKS